MEVGDSEEEREEEREGEREERRERKEEEGGDGGTCLVEEGGGVVSLDSDDGGECPWCDDDEGVCVDSVFPGWRRDIGLTVRVSSDANGTERTTVIVRRADVPGEGRSLSGRGFSVGVCVGGKRRRAMENGL